MPTLSSDLRSKLEKVIIQARDAAEAGALAALESLAVHEPRYYPHMATEEQALRNHLRARARQLGDRQDTSGRLAINHLVGECAYEHWHRMLFARFLAENDLLIEPQDNMVISLAEAEELAAEEGVDVWVFASRCAQQMLPQIFRPDDPLLQVAFAREHRVKLEALLDSLPATVFTASDALGWVYQFWQSKKKDEVNKSEVKIGADEIAAVTQLFTEPYMVEFLLHNTLGAWWAGKRLTGVDSESAESEDDLRNKLALPGVDWGYLRFVQGEDGKGGSWRPAAGTFAGWPKTTAEVKVLDPCCGSGHFLVAALYHLTPMRMVEEGLTAAEAVGAVLRDNLHGLEIDERCCQIAAFALAFAAWTYPSAGGYRPLPELQIACSGIAPHATKEQWLSLGEEIAAEGGMPVKRDLFGAEETLLSAPAKETLEALHGLFAQAPILGSLISPAAIQTDLFRAGFDSVSPLLVALLESQETTDETRERAIAAAGMAKTAELLAADYALVITNVPYLGRAKQSGKLRRHLEDFFYEGKADLATAFVLRCLGFCSKDGSIALVTQQNWWFLSTYRALRSRLITSHSWQFVVTLGEEAWRSFGDRGPVASLNIISNPAPNQGHSLAGIDALPEPNITRKKEMIGRGKVRLLAQKAEYENPDHRITLELGAAGPLLLDYAVSLQGISPADLPHFGRCFWEVPVIDEWKRWQSAVEITKPFGGRSLLLWWCEDLVNAVEAGRAFIRGDAAWGKLGVACRQMRELPATLYEGDRFDTNTAVIVPSNPKHLPAIWCFCESNAFRKAIRRIDRKVNVTNASFCKIPFDLPHWEGVAATRYPNGLPEPESNDPTQWLFHGRPEASIDPLQVAVARLLGYRWPAEIDETMRLSDRARAQVARCDELAGFADADGIVCIPSIRGEEPAAERLRAVLNAAGADPARVHEQTGDTDLDIWLRNSFFEQHCKLFHSRPFVWHIWDGRKRDGFHALVNYHKLCEGGGKGRQLLESLTYSYLGDWIARQKDEARRGEGGAEDRLVAALELQTRLEAILEGEPPFDIFVRWKPLAEQPIGWAPDINDGVRLNIRPFLASDLPTGLKGAGVLRVRPKSVKWTKDRGKEPLRPKVEFPWCWGWDETTEDFSGGEDFDGNRWNGCHYTVAARRAARDDDQGADHG